MSLGSIVFFTHLSAANWLVWLKVQVLLSNMKLSPLRGSVMRCRVGYRISRASCAPASRTDTTTWASTTIWWSDGKLKQKFSFLIIVSLKVYIVGYLVKYSVLGCIKKLKVLEAFKLSPSKVGSILSYFISWTRDKKILCCKTCKKSWFKKSVI